MAWREVLSGIDPAWLVFLDESGATTEMTRRYGRAPRGERIREAAPAGHWRTLTLLGAMTVFLGSPQFVGNNLGTTQKSQLRYSWTYCIY